MSHQVQNSKVLKFIDQLKVVDKFHLDELINRFRHGSLIKLSPNSIISHILTLIFGIVNGVIRVIASLPHDLYVYLKRLQGYLNKVIKGVGGLLHDHWRSFYNEKETCEARNILDGDLIELFLDLSREKVEDVSFAMNVPIEKLYKKIEELTCLY